MKVTLKKQKEDKGFCFYIAEANENGIEGMLKIPVSPHKKDPTPPERIRISVKTQK